MENDLIRQRCALPPSPDSSRATAASGRRDQPALGIEDSARRCRRFRKAE